MRSAKMQIGAHQYREMSEQLGQQLTDEKSQWITLIAAKCI
jgi:hypothetical protein